MSTTDPATAPRRAPGPRRERARAATIGEIKATALGLMRDAGSTEVRFSDIAREMQLTAPALYRYFPDRNALLADLMGDAFEDLADHLERSRDAVPEAAGAPARFEGVLRGLRVWARQDPQRFALAFGPRAGEYVEPTDAPAVGGAQRSMAVLASTLVPTPPVPPGEPTTPYGLDRSGYQRMLQAWIAVHGFVGLEVFGILDWMPDDDREALFDAQIRLALAAAGLAG